MKVYVENHMDSTKILLNLINEFDKTHIYKFNTQKSKAFLYINNEISATKIRKKVPFDIATRKIKYLGINLARRLKTALRKLYITEERN